MIDAHDDRCVAARLPSGQPPGSSESTNRKSARPGRTQRVVGRIVLPHGTRSMRHSTASGSIRQP